MITFDIPDSPGYGFLDFATHVLDYSPAFELRSHMRLGSKAVDAISDAVKAGLKSVSMTDDVGLLFKEAVEKAPIPRLCTVVDGKKGHEIPKTFYMKFYEAAENAISVSEPA